MVLSIPSVKGEKSKTHTIPETCPRLQSQLQGTGLSFSPMSHCLVTKGLSPDISSGFSHLVLCQRYSHHRALYLKFPRTQKMPLAFWSDIYCDRAQTDLFHSMAQVNVQQIPEHGTRERQRRRRRKTTFSQQSSLQSDAPANHTPLDVCCSRQIDWHFITKASRKQVKFSLKEKPTHPLYFPLC